MLVLAVDTSTPTVTTGVAELRDGGDVIVRAERTVTTPRGHAEILTTLILECLGEAEVERSDLDAVVVGCGPGPFTGLRVGMATAAAFADALAIRLYGVCSLDAIAAQAPAGDVLVVTDARRREVYWARYRGRIRVDGPDVCPPAELAGNPWIANVGLVVGSPAHVALVDRPAGDGEAPTTAGLIDSARDVLLAGGIPEPVVPLYLRRPDAVELKDRRR